MMVSYLTEETNKNTIRTYAYISRYAHYIQTDMNAFIYRY
jgi:hypothetical protein